MKPSRTKVFIVVFVLCCLFSALPAWLGGYDFDHRGEVVAVWSVVTAILALIIATVTATEIRKTLQEENQ